MCIYVPLSASNRMVPTSEGCKAGYVCACVNIDLFGHIGCLCLYEMHHVSVCVNARYVCHVCVLSDMRSCFIYVMHYLSVISMPSMC